jgi:Flp pilus assembly protein TadD
LKVGNDQRALDSLYRALKIKPDFLPAQTAAARLELKLGNAEDALRVARNVQRQRPKAGAGYVMEADVLASEQRWEDADQVLKQGLNNAGDPAIAVARYKLLLRSKREDLARKFGNEWISNHRSDVMIRAELAQQAMRQGDGVDAAKQYHEILAIAPKHIIALNNLAWISSRLGDPRGLEYAQRAYSLAPDTPEVLDTLAVLLLEQGDPERAARLLRKAVKLAPQEDGIRLNLAKALILTGDKTGAREELDMLSKRNGNSTAKKEADSLLKTL